MFEGRSELNDRSRLVATSPQTNILNVWPKEQDGSFFKYTSITKGLFLFHERNSKEIDFDLLQTQIIALSKDSTGIFRTFLRKLDVSRLNTLADTNFKNLKSTLSESVDNEVQENSRLLMMYARTQAATQIWIEVNGLNIKVEDVNKILTLYYTKVCIPKLFFVVEPQPYLCQSKIRRNSN